MNFPVVLRPRSTYHQGRLRAAHMGIPSGSTHDHAVAHREVVHGFSGGLPSPSARRSFIHLLHAGGTAAAVPPAPSACGCHRWKYAAVVTAWCAVAITSPSEDRQVTPTVCDGEVAAHEGGRLRRGLGSRQPNSRIEGAGGGTLSLPPAGSRAAPTRGPTAEGSRRIGRRSSPPTGRPVGGVRTTLSLLRPRMEGAS